MKTLIVKTVSGEEHILEADPNKSMMEVIRSAGISDLQAMCGGNCSCSTCHVYIDPAFAVLLPATSSDEAGILEGASAELLVNSRLSCQLRMIDVPDGTIVTIAPAE